MSYVESPANPQKPRTQKDHDTVLVTCIDARYKSLAGLGDPSVFDLIVDATEILADRKDVYDFRPKFRDRLRQSIFIDTLAEFRTFLRNRHVRRFILFSPPADRDKIQPLVSMIQECGARCDIAINKNSVAAAIPFGRLRAVWRKLVTTRSKTLKVQIDTLYYSDPVHLPMWAPVITERRRKKVKHVDAPRYERKTPEYNLLLDSSFPFHNEFKRYKHPIDPRVFYNRIRAFAQIANAETGVDKFIIALHPNSHRQEVAYLGDLQWTIGTSNEVISKANKVWSFGSDATGTAVAYRKKVEYINFPDLLPAKIQNYIFRKGKNFGIPVIEYDGYITSRINTSLFAKKYKLKMYRRTYGMDAPSLSELIYNEPR